MTSRKSKSGGNGASFASGSENMMNQAKEGAENVMDKAREKVGETASQAQQQAKSQIAMGKDRVAESMESVANALRSSTDQMQGQETGFVGDYMNRAADKVSEISQHLRQSDVNQLMHETEDFARREPTIFLAGAFALGLIATRFLKSSGSNMQQNWPGNTGNMAYSKDYAQGSDASGYAGYDSEIDSEIGRGGAGRMDDQPFGGTANMPGSGVMGDQPYVGDVRRGESGNANMGGSTSMQNDAK